VITLVHPTGNEFVRALARHLCQAGKLERLITCMAAENVEWLSTRLPRRMAEDLRRRSFGIPKELLDTRPLRETVRLLSQRFSLRALTQHEIGWACVDAVYRDLDEFAAGRLNTLKSTRAVYCYEDAAEKTFAAARTLGMLRVYDLPIAYWEFGRKLLREEAERVPEWEPTLVGTRDSDEKLERKTRELELADMVICPSTFVLRSLPSTARETKSCIVSEFGSPPVPEAVPRARGEKLRILFAGSMTQRKGLADVFAALKLLRRDDVELVVMGSPIASMEFYRSQYSDFLYEPPRPHADVLALMQSCDVLLLPSILEGRALVQQEAMVCGLPLIVTANAGGEDLVLEGQTGFLVPIRAPERIADHLNWMADHRAETARMGFDARQHASKMTWAAYAQRIVGAIEARLASHG